MMRVLHKSWGIKIELFKNDLCEVSILQLNQNQRCSWHRHRSKWNQFYVLQGSITVRTEEGESEVAMGQVFTTNPTQWHEFRTPKESALVQEIMYVKYDCEDIERADKGGEICSHCWVDTTKMDDMEYVFHCPECGTWRREPRKGSFHHA